MDLPEDVDVVVFGTSLVETMVASSLCVVGTSVLLIDRNKHYGSGISSLPYPSLANFIKEPTIEPNTNSETTKTCLKSYLSKHVFDFSEKWFTNEANLNESLAEPESEVEEFALESMPSSYFDTSLSAGSMESNTISVTLSSDSGQNMDPEFQSSEETTITGQSLLRLTQINKSDLLARLRRVDIDLFPKLLLCESANMEATLRSGIHRYITLRFINGLLACDENSLIEIPLCRRDIFTNKNLNFKQKRTLGAFLEWCFELKLEESEEYISNSEKPLKDFLAEKFHQDQFTQTIVIHTIVMAQMDVLVKQGVEKVRALLFSMNKFGPLPLLVPIYGSADFTMAYARLAAVFAGTTCLDTGFEKIDDDQSSQRRYQVKLTNGQVIKTDYIVMGTDYVDQSLTGPLIKEWLARAVFIIDGSLCGKRDKNLLLPFPQLKYAGLREDFVPFILQGPIDGPPNDKFNLHLTQACALAERRIDNLPACFESMAKTLFVGKYGNGDSKKPRLLCAFYFQFPIMSEIPVDLLGKEHVYVAPGPDSSLFLDSCIPKAEEIFRSIYEAKFLTSKDPSSTSAATTQPPGEFTSLHAFWDGIFPPKPPKPEHIHEELLQAVELEIGQLDELT